MSNDKVPATFHPDADLAEQQARVAEERGKRQTTQHFDPSDAPIPHAHMDEH